MVPRGYNRGWRVVESGDAQWKVVEGCGAPKSAPALGFRNWFGIIMGQSWDYEPYII